MFGPEDSIPDDVWRYLTDSDYIPECNRCRYLPVALTPLDKVVAAFKGYESLGGFKVIPWVMSGVWATYGVDTRDALFRTQEYPSSFTSKPIPAEFRYVLEAIEAGDAQRLKWLSDNRYGNFSPIELLIRKGIEEGRLAVVKFLVTLIREMDVTFKVAIVRFAVARHEIRIAKACAEHFNLTASALDIKKAPYLHGTSQMHSLINISSCSIQ